MENRKPVFQTSEQRSWGPTGNSRVYVPPPFVLTQVPDTLLDISSLGTAWNSKSKGICRSAVRSTTSLGQEGCILEFQTSENLLNGRVFRPMNLGSRCRRVKVRVLGHHTPGKAAMLMTGIRLHQVGMIQELPKGGIAKHRIRVHQILSKCTETWIWIRRCTSTELDGCRI